MSEHKAVRQEHIVMLLRSGPWSFGGMADGENSCDSGVKTMKKCGRVDIQNK
jgi:hypothetical protein